MSGSQQMGRQCAGVFVGQPSVCVSRWGGEGETSPIEHLGPDVDFGPSDVRPRTVEQWLYIQHSLEWYLPGPSSFTSSQFSGLSKAPPPWGMEYSSVEDLLVL